MISARATDAVTWRDEARRLLASDVAPEDVVWGDGVQASLFGEASTSTSTSTRGKGARVPAEFVEKAEMACCHSSPDRFAVLYRLLWKISHGVHALLSDPLDPDVIRLNGFLRDVREEEHRMHAFVRFRRAVLDDETEHWISWFAPAHHVLERVAPFFARRYPAMKWSMFTPERSAHWDTKEITYSAGAGRDTAPDTDELDALFLSYYASIYNPARTNPTVLRHHIPTYIQEQIPEGAIMQSLMRSSAPRVARLTAPKTSASSMLLPAARDLESLARAACDCRACPIGERATQTVFGEGPRDAKLMIVGEQPGDEEDRAGHPFVGPAGRLLDAIMKDVGFDRSTIYVTNAVKHFKWEPRGKRRLHSRPNPVEIDACRGWLTAEVDAIKPAMILCLGATAGQSFVGRGFRVQRDRGKPMPTPWAPWFMATYHPSALLRAEDDDHRRELEGRLRADLALTYAELTRRA